MRRVPWIQAGFLLAVATASTAVHTARAQSTVIGDLPPGASITIEFTVQLANPVAAGVDQVSNQGTITASNLPGSVLTDDPATGAPNDPTLTPVTANPDLTLAKSDGGATTTPGGTVLYQLTATNVGNQGAAGVVFNETVPLNTTFNAGASTGTWSCANGSPAGTICTQGPLVIPGGSAFASTTFAVTVVNPVPAGVTEISNAATVADNGANGADPTPANNSAADTTPLTANPDLSLAKSDGGVSVAPGGTVTYVLTATNSGNQGAVGVVLTDTVPANSTFNAGASSAGWSCADGSPGGTICTNAGIALIAGGGASDARNFAVTVVNPVPAGVSAITNDASVADDGANGADPTPANNAASDTTPVDANPDLALTKSDGGVSAVPGGTIVYTLSTTNVGNQGAAGIVLTDTVPPNTTFNAAGSSGGWSCADGAPAGSVCTNSLGGLAAGAAAIARTFAVTVVNPIPAGVSQISNGASVADDGANGADPAGNNSANDTTPVDANPDLALQKSDGGVSAVPGGTIAYVLTTTNIGNQGASGIVLSETVPANTTFNAGASTGVWSCADGSPAATVCTQGVGGLAGGGASVPATFAVTVINPVPAGLTQISNSATVADDGANGTDPAGNNGAADTTPVDANPDLAMAKSDGGATVAPGGTVVYTLTATNIGNQGATGVVLSETVPANTTFNATSSTGVWSCANGSPAGTPCTTPLGGIAGGSATAAANFAVTVINPVPAGVDQISNTASVADDGTNGTDPSGNNSGSDTTPLNANPDLALTKSDGGATAVPGGTIAYTLATTNIGNQGATGIVLTETVPVNTTFNSGASSAGWSCADGSPAGTPCTNAVGGLAAGAPAINRTFAVTVVNPIPAGVTEISNTGSVADDGANGADPAGNNSATDTTPVTAAPDLAMDKTHGGGVPFPGDAITFDLAYSNGGNQGATGVVLTETVPLNTTFESTGSTAGWSCADEAPAGTVCTLAVGALAGGGGSGTAVFVVELDDPLPPGTDEVDNCASVADDAANGADPNTANNEDCIVVGLDNIPPTVTALSAAGNVITDCETLLSSGTSLRAVFDEPMADPPGSAGGADVTNPANYRLVTPGPDFDFQTLSCTVGGDDVALTIDSVSYNAVTNAATVSFAATIPNAQLRFFACPTLTDAASNPLDGDDDGTGGDAFQRDFRMDHGNLLQNGHFDCDLGSWTVVAGTPAEIFHDPAVDADDADLSGTAHATNLAPGLDTSFRLEQCVAVPVGGPHDLSAEIRLDAAAGVNMTVTARCRFFSALGCTGNLGNAAQTLLISDTGGAFFPIALDAMTPVGTAAMTCGITFTTPTAASFEGFIDRLTLIGPELIFRDGFESGDTSAWSEVTP